MAAPPASAFADPPPAATMDTAAGKNPPALALPAASPTALAYFAAHPRRPQVYFGNYLLLQTLGEGEFGKVKLGVHRAWGEEVAIKLIKRDKVAAAEIHEENKMSKVEREIKVLKNVRHPNIVYLYEVIESERYIGMVLEYGSGGELFDYILAHKCLRERDACRLFAQLVSGVSYLHRKNIIHRDLKLENLLLDRNSNVIITDFGFANDFSARGNDLMATSCGSPCYAAPELVVQDGLYVGAAVDVWSCGVILYAMLAGYLPFDDDPANPDGDNINLLYKYIMSTPLTFPDYIGAEPRSLLSRMLVPDPTKRATLEEVMAHPWLAPYRDLFRFSVDELERAAVEQQTKRRHTYRQQMQQQQQQQQKMAEPASVPTSASLPVRLDRAAEPAPSGRALPELPAETPVHTSTPTTMPETEKPAPVEVPQQPQEDSLGKRKHEDEPVPQTEEAKSRRSRTSTTSSPAGARQLGSGLSGAEPSLVAMAPGVARQGSARRRAAVPVSQSMPQNLESAGVPVAPSAPITTLPQTSQTTNVTSTVPTPAAPLSAATVPWAPRGGAREMHHPTHFGQEAPSLTALLPQRLGEQPRRRRDERPTSMLAPPVERKGRSSLESELAPPVTESVRAVPVRTKPRPMSMPIAPAMPHLEVPTAPGRVSLDYAPGRVSLEAAPSAAATAGAAAAAAAAAAGTGSSSSASASAGISAGVSSAPNSATPVSHVVAPHRQHAPQKQTHSSNPAKRIMAWFRRKSHAPATLAPVYEDSSARRSRPRQSTEAHDEPVILDHVGALDPSAITKRPPAEVMRRVLDELEEMGISVRREGNALRVECVRPRRTSPGLKALFGSRSAHDRPRNSRDSRQSTSMSSVLHPRLSLAADRESAEIDRTLARMSLGHAPEPYSTPLHTPLYGESSRDGGQEIHFYVQVTRIPTLRGLYSVDVRLIKGNHWTFQYLYEVLLGRLELGDSV
ncbi:hypothetical protein MCUN1_003812 [Malassezia cuniculi]|uniref:Non-specific serine/threonine protein kinase n=1 Tax=Malassezia cuniculi TaxID=948313 RepID=A0AAF0EXL5_9BASI|nr:hypothetical protein MCUN1_003812 [Malassezia cuniculi]